MYSPDVSKVLNLHTLLELSPSTTPLNPSDEKISIEYSIGKFGKSALFVQSNPAVREDGFLAAVAETPV